VRGSCRECNGVLVQPTQCILCNNTVRKDYLTRHINTVHADSDFFNKSNTTYEYATDSDDEFIT
jgi:hypothetical protein